MHHFAHNGVTHGTTVESAGHTFNQVVLTFLLVSLVVLGLMILGSFVVKRLTTEDITPKNNKEQ